MLVEINWKPADRQLRQFGLFALFALPLAAWLWSGGSVAVTVVSAAIGGLLAVSALIRPRALKPVFISLSLIAAPIGIVVGEVILAAIYIALFLPIGLVFRLIGRDALQRRLNPGCQTYWTDKAQPKTAASYYRQW